MTKWKQIKKKDANTCWFENVETKRLLTLSILLRLRWTKRPYLPIIDVAMTTIFSLKISNNLLAHLDPQPICEVQHVMPRLALPPLVPAVCLKHLLGAVHPPGGSPSPKVVEPRDTEPAIQPVEGGDPLVQLNKILLPVYMSRRGRAIVWEPDHFGRV